MTSAARTSPISSHPAFKWAVGLWFAVLLGLGLFVMPESVHAALTERLGLAGLLPAGAAGRAILAAAAGLSGLVLGLLVAGRIAALNRAEGEEVWIDDERELWLGDDSEVSEEGDAEPAPDPRPSPRRPFNPLEDIGETGIGTHSDAADRPDADGGPANGPAFAEMRREEPAAATAAAAGPAADSQTPEAMAAAGEASAVEADRAAIPDGPLPVATGDLSLAQLTERLEAALAACKAVRAAPGANGSVPDPVPDPVIAALRREAELAGATGAASGGGEDPQTALRDALAKLSRLDRSE